jgi:hypothetical protein
MQGGDCPAFLGSDLANSLISKEISPVFAPFSGLQSAFSTPKSGFDGPVQGSAEGLAGASPALQRRGFVPPAGMAG